jgi:hypothetical protein
MKLSKTLAVVFALAVVLTIAADAALKVAGHSEGELWGAEVIGYWAAFGLVWYLIIVAFSKGLGRYWLERGEGYYGEGSEEDE